MSEPNDEKRSFGGGLAIVIATYNEIENLPKLVENLFDLLPEAAIVVVDDQSPDGTGKWCDENRNRFPSLNCLHRSGKLGLGSATVEGFRWAIKNGHSLVATMDADFSHAPSTLPVLVKTMEQANNDTAVVIGSRYTEGGAIEGWPIFRRFASKAVNGFARYWLGLRSRDNSGAFRVYQTNALKKIGIDSIRSESFSYLEEVLYRLERAGYESIEYPITFRDRERGITKTDWKLGVKVFWELFRMRDSAAGKSSKVSRQRSHAAKHD